MIRRFPARMHSQLTRSIRLHGLLNLHTKSPVAEVGSSGLDARNGASSESDQSEIWKRRIGRNSLVRQWFREVSREVSFSMGSVC